MPYGCWIVFFSVPLATQPSPSGARHSFVLTQPLTMCSTVEMKNIERIILYHILKWKCSIGFIEPNRMPSSLSLANLLGREKNMGQFRFCNSGFYFWNKTSMVGANGLLCLCECMCVHARRWLPRDHNSTGYRNCNSNRRIGLTNNQQTAKFLMTIL